MQAADTHIEVELEAALEIADWKREFARHLRCEATKITGPVGGVVVLRRNHFRRALAAAMTSTLSAIEKTFGEERDNYANPKAA